MLLCNKPTWDKILSRLKHKPNVSDWTIINEKYEDILNNARGDLLSVCVLPEYRGKGYAQGMIESFLEAMRCHGQKLCLLSVKTDNVRARRYYERNGFELYRKRGEEGLTYIKRL
jgi:ribosomal protein S18 acetylase RimI-like enzyme